jgi:hypothetical protein
MASYFLPVELTPASTSNELDSETTATAMYSPPVQRYCLGLQLGLPTI